MQSVSSKFKNALRTSGQRKTVLDVYRSFTATLLFENVPVLDGTITVDRTADIRRSGTLKIGKSDLTDSILADGMLTNNDSFFNLEFKISHGVVFPDGSEELVQLGVFNASNLSREEGSNDYPSIDLSDRMKYIQRAPLSSAKDYSGMFTQDVIEVVVTEVIPSASVVFDAELSNPRMPGGSIFDGDRLEILKKCAESLGAEFYFDHLGVLQVIETKDPTDVTQPTVWEFNVGEGWSETQNGVIVGRPPGNLISADRTVSRDETYNAVAVYGAAPSDTVGQPYALVYDNDTNSPTYYFGSFGKSVKRIDNQLITTQEDCVKAATAELKNNLGLVREIGFAALGNPALEAGDYCTFTWLDDTQESHLLDSFSIPLGSGDFTGSTRTAPPRQTASVGIVRGNAPLDQPPEAPGTPQLVAVGDYSIHIKWSASSSANGVKWYDVYANGVLKYTTVSTFMNISGFNSGSFYKLTVRAVDKAGLQSDHSGHIIVKTTGAYTPPDPSLNEHSKTYTGIWSRTYLGTAGTSVSSYDPFALQGDWPSISGNFRSLIGLPHSEIASDLAGATIVGCEVFLRNYAWANNSSGTLVLGTHKYTDRPSSWSSSNVSWDRVRSGSLLESAGRWVSFGPVIGDEFRTQAARGIAIGPGPTTSITYAGSFYGVGAHTGSATPKLRLTWRL